MIPKEIKCNLHYDGVRGEIFRPPQNFSDSNTDDSFTLVDSNFVFLGNSSHTLGKQILRDSLQKFSYFIINMYLVCTAL